MLFICTIGVLGCVEIINLLRQAGNKVFKTILGYAWIPEIIFSILLPVLAAATGTISGVAIAAVTGTLVTITFEVCKRIVGTRKYKKVNGKRQWVETEGVTVAEFVRNLGIATFNKVVSFGKTVIA